MNFIEAVTALKNGECEGIILPGSSKPIKGSHHMKHDDGEYWIGYIPAILSDDWELVNPTPKTEEVEVKRYWCPGCGKIAEETALWCGCMHKPVELTGHYSRPIPWKVKKRVEGDVEWQQLDTNKYPINVLGKNKFDFNQVTGKTGKLIFEWEEADG